jgi:miniconductance mechanosensitive channel
MGIVILANLLGKSPFIYLSGLGAMAAVFSFIFKDSILGLVAGMLLSLNDMLRIGDWIEMPKYGADGDVIDVTMNTVKVQNFDRTITTIPAYALISDSFRNWRGMQETGGRRIKRAINIDTSSVKFCTHDMLDKYKKIHLLNEYIESKEKEIEEYNSINQIDTSLLVNGRHLTNIGTFRIYIANYLKHHPKIHQGLIQIVRQLPPSENGLPLEIYAFTNDINWVNYEGIQADIFDHILAVAKEFDLDIFQNPTGQDIRNIGNKKKTH